VSLQGRLAVVTGGGAGIGAGIAEHLRGKGAKVVTVDVEPTSGASEIADLAEDAGAVAARLVEKHGPFELIVNNVGVTPRSGFLETDEAEFDRVLALNLRGPWFFTKRLVEALIDADRPGSIVFVSSLHDRFVSGKPHYSASKAAVTMLARELAWSLAEHRIRVNVVAPGAIFNGRNDLTPDRDYPSIPAARPGTGEDVAKVVAALLDDDVSGYVTGARVPVDGGLALHTWMGRR
jgi:glucose 1-dehydrogenase